MNSIEIHLDTGKAEMIKSILIDDIKRCILDYTPFPSNTGDKYAEKFSQMQLEIINSKLFLFRDVFGYELDIKNFS